jgi:hypothetical protein
LACSLSIGEPSEFAPMAAALAEAYTLRTEFGRAREAWRICGRLFTSKRADTIWCPGRRRWMRPSSVSCAEFMRSNKHALRTWTLKG